MNVMTKMQRTNGQQTPSRSIRVLLVEDDRDLRMGIREYLELRGMKVDTADAGPVAVDRLWNRTYDVVVCDLRLPGLDGFGVYRSLRTLPKAPPMILITANPEWRVIDEARSLGIKHVVRKPLNLARLADLVEQLNDSVSKDSVEEPEPWMN